MDEDRNSIALAAQIKISANLIRDFWHLSDHARFLIVGEEYSVCRLQLYQKTPAPC